MFRETGRTFACLRVDTPPLPNPPPRREEGTRDLSLLNEGRFSPSPLVGEGRGEGESRGLDERGVALVLTLIIVALVSVLVLEYHFEAVVELDLADNYGSDVRAYHVAMSGMRLAQELLAYDDKQSDGPQDSWHRIGLIPACMPPQTILMLAIADAAAGSLGAGLAGQEAAPDAAVTEGLDRGCVSLNIEVEEERLPVNALMPVALPDNAGEALTEEAARMLEDWEVVFETLFVQHGIDSALLDALTGWLEDNGPMRTVRELSLVPGFDPETVSKLSPFVTAYGSPRLDGETLAYPKVNVNTADRQVLHALIDGLSDGAGDVTGYVDDIMVLRQDSLLQGRQFESTSELQDDLPAEVQAVFDKFATVQGTYFTVTSVARVEDIEKTVVAVLRPGGDGDDEPVYFKVE